MDDHVNDHVGELLDRYRTGELGEPDRLRVERHLEVCEACQSELEGLAAFARVVEDGYAAEQAARAAEGEPDWARLKASIVGRTSARASAARRAWLGVPQAALAVLALVALGVLWQQGVRSPGEAEQILRSERPAGSREVGARERSGGPVPTPGADRKETAAGEDRFAEAGAQEGRERINGTPPAVSRDEPGDQRRGVELEDREFRGNVDEVERDADRAVEQAPADHAENLAEPAAPVEEAENRVDAKARPEAAHPAPQAPGELGKAAAAPPPPELERFQRDARSALSEADTLLAARALSQWRDSLAPRRDLPPELERVAQALADSLAAFLATRP